MDIEQFKNCIFATQLKNKINMRKGKFLTRSGIYKIVSEKTNDCYIGSASNLSNRKSDHFRTLKVNKHGNPNLQAHANKYGISDLRFSIIEFCDKPDLKNREQFYMDKLSPTFNIHKKSTSPEGRTVSEETKKKISESHKGLTHTKETKKKLSEYWTGKPKSEETKKKMSEAQKGKTKSHKGKPWSEARRKAQENRKKKN